MTSYKDALVLLNDLEEFADSYHFPKAEELISKARAAIERDLGTQFPPVRNSHNPAPVYLVDKITK